VPRRPTGTSSQHRSRTVGVASRWPFIGVSMVAGTMELTRMFLCLFHKSLQECDLTCLAANIACNTLAFKSGALWAFPALAGKRHVAGRAGC
jgi:hypothetical protein